MNVSVFTLKDKILFNKASKIQSLKGDGVKNVDKLIIYYDDVYFIHFDYSFDCNNENYFYIILIGWTKKWIKWITAREHFNIKVTIYADFT